ncbi:MAG: beta-hexosaminidase [Rubrobacter sp.]|nr:beta-hexosaminidase [Rubrobacter sp.]
MKLASFALLVMVALLAGCGGSEGGDSRSPDKPSKEKTEQKNEASGEPKEMNVREMVGQMFVVSVGGTEPDYYIEKMVRERNIGGVLLFGYNMKSEEQVKALTGSLQKLSMRTAPAIPLFVGVDQEGGEVASAPWVATQPAAAEVGGRGDPAEARAVAEEIGADLLKAGVNTDFAPVADTGFGAAIGTRAFGEDPALVSPMVKASVEGFDAAGVVASAKHFPNHGPAQSDSHVSLPVVEHDAATIESYDLPPFRAAVEAGVPMVMVGHLIYPAIDPEKPASLSPKAIGMLREDLDFGGVVVTDDLAMEGANGGEPPARAAVEAVKAGADLLIISSPPEEQAAAYDAVVKAVESGEIPEERIKKSVERLLKVKERYGLYGTGEH